MNVMKLTRWRFFAVLFAMSFLSYMMRQNIHVAGEHMMPELGLSETQMGWIFASFIWGYTIFQLPGGIAGKRFGARLTLAVLGIFWMLTCALTGLLPGMLVTSGSGILVALVLIRFLTGAVHAPIYPVQAGATEAWFPVGRWAMPSALSTCGMTLGAAVTQPIVAWIMVTWGWRVSFFVFIPLGIVIFALWWWYARDNPADHPSMQAEELADINRGREALAAATDPGAWKRLLVNRDTLLLTISYFAMNYVFYLFFTWFFHYLVKELGFTILESGFLAALPWLSGAVAAVLGGWSCDRLCVRFGARWGCRIPAMGGLLASAVLLYVGLFATSPYVAVTLLSLCFAATQFTDAAFWQAQTFIAGADTAPATGILNTGGNVPGIVVAPLMPYLAAQFGWVMALSTGVAVAFIGGLLWLFIRADRPFDMAHDA